MNQQFQEGSIDQQTGHPVGTGMGDGQSKTLTFTITQLAEEFSITTRAIRFYEDKGLLHPLREGQTRIYRPRDRARLILVVRGRRVGFTLAEIKEIIDLYNLEDGGEAHYRLGLKKFRERIEQLKHQREEIGIQIKELEDGCERVEKILTARFDRECASERQPCRT